MDNWLRKLAQRTATQHRCTFARPAFAFETRQEYYTYRFQAIDETMPKIVYDGECPFCSQYVRMARLRDSFGPVTLIDARQDDTLVEELAAKGYDLNEGMVLIDGDDIYYGADCMNRIALMSTRMGPFNRLNAMIFRNRGLSRVLYPILRTGRNMTLALMGRSRIARSKTVQ